MKRKSTVKVRFADGTIAEAVITTSARSLTRDESQRQHDAAVDNVASSLRSLPYAPDAPLRAVEIR